MNFVLFVSDKNWRKAVIFVNTQVLCRIVPSLIIGCESIDFEIRTSKLLTHMDGHVDKVIFSYLAGMSPYISLKIKKRHYEHHMIEAHKYLITWISDDISFGIENNLMFIRF